MAKNKNKKNVTVNNTEKKVEEVKVEATVMPPVEGPDGAVETPPVEEVVNPTQEETKPSITKPTLIELVEAMKESDEMDANHAAIFLAALERRVSKMKPNQPATIKMESMLDYNMAWYAVRLAVQTTKEKKRFNMLTPADEVTVQEFIDTFSSLGVALEAHPTPDGQMALEFKEISEATKKAAEEENAAAVEIKKEAEGTAPSSPTSTAFKHKEWTDDDLNPENWVNDDEARAALKHILNIPGQSPSIRFLNALAKLRLYLKKGGKDETNIGVLAKEFVKLMGNKNISIVINGIGSSIVNSMSIDGTVIFAHSILRKNMPALSDEEVRDLVKAFVEINNSEKKYEDTNAVKNGIIGCDRDKLIRIVKQEPDESKHEELKTFKKIFNPFYMIYHEEVGGRTILNEKTNETEVNPNFEINAINKMIEIHNLYVEKGKEIKLLTAAEYKK